ncbi:MAG: alanine--glyoxylate aminotransferase family protein [Deltaproteobacteria bacterium]|nr:alanine--glyoxylate aminotransferase family protein [Deltaproteobacteria bacterium]
MPNELNVPRRGPNELNVPRRVLLGPGPSEVGPRVLRAMSTPLVGHLDPSFVALMEEVKELLRQTFRTANRLTFPLSATGSAGMEAVLVNLLEPGDHAVICVNGVFGGRMVEIARRAGAEVTSVEVPWGEVIDADLLRKTLEALPASTPLRLVACVHAETSTGARQPLEDLSRVAHERGALFVVDAVTSLGGTPVEVDAWGIDASYSGTQKCLSCPPGLSPVTFGEAALARVRERKHKVQSWYLDVSLLEQYWGTDRVYHHTAPISMVYALHEALRVVHEEGLEARFARHVRHHRALVAGLDALGMKMPVAPEYRLPMLNSVFVPGGVDEATVRKRMLERHGIEIGAGLGPWKGQVWRIGLMGDSSTPANVLLVLAALAESLGSSAGGAALGAAERVLAAA